MTIAIKPTASGSTIEQNGSTILTVDSSGNIAIANDLTVTGTFPTSTPDALSTASGSAPSYSARAWVQYHGSNGTVNGNGNVSSVTDNGTGDFTVNFTTAMADTNYSWAIGYAVNLGVGQRNRGFFELENISTGSLRVYQIDSSGNAWDISLTAVQVFR